jgi:hypothetical protein
VVAAVAEHEGEMVSERTRAGLAATKEQGMRLGALPVPAINETRQADAAAQAQAIGPVLAELAGIRLTRPPNDALPNGVSRGRRASARRQRDESGARGSAAFTLQDVSILLAKSE